MSPRWEEAFTFPVGSFLPPKLLWLLGATSSRTGYDRVDQLKVKVLDEDDYSSDDLLGTCSVDLAYALQSPEEWKFLELSLDAPPGAKKGDCGTLTLSLCWEPAPIVPPYLLHLVAVACFASGFAMFVIGASCRWQSHEMGEWRQPGVGATCALGAGCLLLATIVQFLRCHVKCHTRLDDLAAAHNSARVLSNALVAFREEQPRTAKQDPALLVKVRPAGLTQYELSVAPAMDVLEIIQLPLIVMAWLFPIAGVALAALSVVLQILQVVFANCWDRCWRALLDCFCVGELLVSLVFPCVFAGLAATIFAEVQEERFVEYRAQRLVSHRRRSHARETAHASREVGRRTRLSVLWRSLGFAEKASQCFAYFSTSPRRRAVSDGST